jgi:hypothetical protein
MMLMRLAMALEMMVLLSMTKIGLCSWCLSWNEDWTLPRPWDGSVSFYKMEYFRFVKLIAIHESGVCPIPSI